MLAQTQLHRHVFRAMENLLVRKALTGLSLDLSPVMSSN